MRYFFIFIIGSLAIILGSWWFTDFDFSPQSPPTKSYNGIWNGHFDINGRGNFKFNALYIDNKLIAFSPDAKVSYQGTYRIKDKLYHSDMDMYLLTNGGYFDSVTLTGKIISPGKVEAQFLTHDAKDSGTLILEQDNTLYEKDSHLSKVIDQWIYYHGFTITKFSIEKDGRIDGADTNGCGYEGEINVVSEEYNAYLVKLLLNSCHELDGVYQGMAYLLSSVDEDDTLNIQVYKDGQALYLPIVRDTKDSNSQSENPT